MAFLAGVVVVACGALLEPTAPLHTLALTLSVDSAHAKIQRQRLDTIAARLTRYCKTNKPAQYVCTMRPMVDSGRALEVYTAPQPTVDTTPVQPPPPPPPIGVIVQPGQSIQGAVDANPAGTTFLLKAGTHVRQSVVPKDGDTFRGERGTILDGQGATVFAFKGYNGARWINSVVLRGLAITRYTPPAQNGAIYGGDDRTAATTSWVLDSLDVSYSTNLGVRIGNRMRVTNSYLHHNATLNIGGVGIGVLVEGNEIAYANPALANDPGFESGGTKFVKTDSLVVRNNYVHHNGGPGIWTDIENDHVLIEANRADSNAREGIVHEIGYSAVIRNNTVTGNGTGDPYRAQGWLWNAGIGVHASRDVEVYGNTLLGNANAIVGLQQARGAGSNGAPYLLQNLYVHDNTTTQAAPGATGIACDYCTDTAIFTSWGNRFQNNRYTLGSNPYPFAWMNSYRTAAQWQSYGQDSGGAFSP